MSAQIIDGRAIAAQVYSELTTRVAVLKAKGVIPRVAIIHVGTEEMTKRYVTLKESRDKTRHGMRDLSSCGRCFAAAGDRACSKA